MPPLAPALLAATLLFAAGPGCSTVERYLPANRTEARLPPQELIVGGGFQIAYTPGQPGTAVLADRNRGQILITKTLAAGETYRFDFDPTSPQYAGLFETEGKHGLVYARPTLYFLPDVTSGPADNAPATPSFVANAAEPAWDPAPETLPATTENPFDQ